METDQRVFYLSKTLSVFPELRRGVINAGNCIMQLK